MEAETTASRSGPKPKLELTEPTLEQIRALGRIQCTVEEAASVLRVSRRTLFNFFNLHPEAKETFEEGQHEGCASLRRKQFAMAEKNATMAIWLGKQYLGQRDRVEMDARGSIEIDMPLDKLDMARRIAHVLLEAAPKATDPPDMKD